MGQRRKGVARRNRLACGLCKPWRLYGNGKDGQKANRYLGRRPGKHPERERLEYEQ